MFQIKTKQNFICSHNGNELRNKTFQIRTKFYEFTHRLNLIFLRLPRIGFFLQQPEQKFDQLSLSGGCVALLAEGGAMCMYYDF